MHALETLFQIMNFDLVQGSILFDTLLVLGSGRKLQPPVSHAIMRVNNLHTYNHSVSTQLLFLTFSTVKYMRYLTIYPKTGFVSDDFAQLEANVSALSTFKVG